MAIADPVKNFLRTFGHALVSSVHDRLTSIELRLDEASAKLNYLTAGSESNREKMASLSQDLAASDAALLTASIRLVEASKELHALYDGHTDLLARVETLNRTVAHELSKLHAQVNQTADVQASVQAGVHQEYRQSIEALAATQAVCLDRIDATSAKTETVAELVTQLGGIVSNGLVHQECVETGDYDFNNPEVGLVGHLHAYLPSRRAIDVGANSGEVSLALVKAGYEVYAFEPSPTIYGTLVNQLASHSQFHPFQLAIGSADGEMPLFLASDLSPTTAYGDASQYSSLAPHSMPDDLPFTDQVMVPVRTLASLHDAGTLPSDIGLLKIDTEGYDLEVIRGMGPHLYPVVAAEFWDAEIPFAQAGQRYTLENLIDEMQRKGYHWHVVLYRIWGRDYSAYYCGYHRSVPQSWGNVFFFRSYDLFSQAQKWCSAVLPSTYFKPLRTAVPNPDAEVVRSTLESGRVLG